MMPILDATALRTLAERAQAQPDVPDCGCRKTLLEGWQSQPLSLDESLLEQVGTLRASEDEPGYDEYLPDGLRYWSPDAPIAPRYFPYNQCDVWACTRCARLLLRYVEGGGYFVDRRIRAVRAELIVDAA